MSPYDPAGYSDQFTFQPQNNGAAQYAAILAGQAHPPSIVQQNPQAASALAKLVAAYKRKKMMDALNSAGSYDPTDPNSADMGDIQPYP